MTQDPLSAPPNSIAGGQFCIPLWRSLAVLAVVGTALGICWIGPNPNSPTQPGVTMKLPIWVGDFLGEPGPISLSEETILPEDTEFARMEYRSPIGDIINCQIVLSGGQRRSIHQPEVCLPGQGWNIKTGTAIPVTMKDGSTLQVMKLGLSRPVSLQDGTVKTLRCDFIYWFVGKDITTPYHWKRIFLSSYDRVVSNLNHRWAYVIVSSPVTADLSPNGKDEEATLAMLKEFIRDAAPTFMKQYETPTTPLARQ